MKLGIIGRAWLGFQAVKFVKTVVDERRDYHARHAQFHGYTWPRVQHVLGMCCEAEPDLHSKLMAMSEEDRNAILTGILTCHPATFRKRFGFDRPSP